MSVYLSGYVRKVQHVESWQKTEVSCESLPVEGKKFFIKKGAIYGTMTKKNAFPVDY